MNDLNMIKRVMLGSRIKCLSTTNIEIQTTRQLIKRLLHIYVFELKTPCLADEKKKKKNNNRKRKSIEGSRE